MSDHTYTFATETPYGDVVMKADPDDVQETITEMREQIEAGEFPVEFERTLEGGEELLFRYEEEQARELLDDMESWLNWVVS